MKSTLFRFSLFFLIVVSVSSCVSSKKIAYVQKEESYKKDFENFNETYKQVKDSLILEENDVLSVTVNHLQLTQNEVHTGLEGDANARLGVRHPFLIGFPIDAEGNIDLPTLGKTKVVGLTLSQAEDVIRTKAKNYYPDPSVKIFMLSNFVTVLGEVNSPGRFPMYNNSMTVFDALGMAKDMTDYADRNDVRIMRRRAGTNHLYHINLNDDDLLATNELYIQPDDVILVTPLKAKKFIRRDSQSVLNTIGTAISLVTLYLLLTE